MMQEYFAVLIQMAAAVVIAGGALVTSVILGKRGRRNPVKDSAYECGMEPVGPASARFSVKFYLIAMLFILFDIEVVFLYPWAVVYRDMVSQSMGIFWGMLIFQLVLAVGFLYELRKGALDWSR